MHCILHTKNTLDAHNIYICIYMFSMGVNLYLLDCSKGMHAAATLNSSYQSRVYALQNFDVISYRYGGPNEQESKQRNQQKAARSFLLWLHPKLQNRGHTVDASEIFSKLTS